MYHPPNSVEEAAKSVNPGDQGLPASDPSEYFRSESHIPVEPNENIVVHGSGIREIDSFESPDRHDKKT